MSPTGERRRRYPRIEIEGAHGVQDLTGGHDVRLRDLSVGGFQTESPRSVAPGQQHTFRVTFSVGSPCLVRARAVHIRPAPGRRRSFLVGWQAEHDSVTVESMTRLIAETRTADGGVAVEVTRAR